MIKEKGTGTAMPRKEPKKRKMSENSLKNLEKGKCFFSSSKEVAREVQKKSAKKRSENVKKRKEIEAFQISSQKSLSEIQIPTLKNLAKFLEKLSIKENLTPAELKALIEGLEFLRDSSGQMPTQKVELESSLQVKQGLEKINEYFGNN